MEETGSVVWIERGFDALLVVIGGLIALASNVVAQIIFNQQARRRKRNRVASNLIHKTYVAANEIFIFQREFREMIEGVEGLPEDEIWKAMLPLVGAPSKEQEIGVDELELLREVSENEFFNSVSELLSAHRIIMASVRAYSEFRDALQDLVSDHTEFEVVNGRLQGTTNVDPQAHPRLHGKVLQCGVQAKQLLDTIDKDAEKAHGIIADMNRIADENKEKWGNLPQVEIGRPQ